MSKLSFCPPNDTYVFNFENSNCNISDWKLRSQSCSGEMLLAQFANKKTQKLSNKWREKVCRIIKDVECFYTYSAYGNRIACIFIEHEISKSRKEDLKTLVFSHANAEGNL